MDDEAMLDEVLTAYQQAGPDRGPPRDFARGRLLERLHDKFVNLAKLVVPIARLAAALLPSTIDRPPAPADANLPDDLPGYEIVRELGRGGMGVVFLARQKCPDRWVALKFLKVRPGSPDFDRHRDALLAEATVQAGFRHDNIVPVYEVNASETAPYYAMQYIDGRTLSEEIASWQAARGDEPSLRNTRPSAGPPDRHALAADIGIALAGVIADVHTAGFVHRDIKPSNMMLDTLPGGRRKVYLTDFGLAGRRDQPAADGGTPLYMAPEDMARPPAPATDGADSVGRVSADRPATTAATAPRVELPPTVSQRVSGRPAAPASDVYSLGATLYEVVTLERAHGPGRTAASVPKKVRMANRHVPRDLAAVIDKALTLEPADRYQTFVDLADDLRAFQAGRMPAARPGRLIRYGRVVGNNRLLFTLLSLIMAGLAAWGVYSQTVAAREREMLAESDGLTELLCRALDGWKPVRGSDLKDSPVTSTGLIGIVGRALDGWKPVRGVDSNASAGDPRPERVRRLNALLADLDAYSGNGRTRLVGGTVAECLEALGDTGAARAVYERNLREWLAAEGPDHPDTLRAGVRVVTRTPRSDPAFGVATAELERIIGVMGGHPAFGPDHRDTLLATAGLADNYRARGNLVAAVRLYDEAAAGLERVAGPTDPDRLTVEVFRAACRRDVLKGYADPDRQAALLKLVDDLRLVVRALRETAGEFDPDTLRGALILAGAYSELRQFDSALTNYENVLRGRLVVHGPTHPLTLEASTAVGNCLLHLARPVDAVPYLERGHFGRPVKDGEIPTKEAVEALSKLARAYCETGHPDGPKLLHQAVPLELASRAKSPAATAEFLTAAGQAFHAAGDYREAAIQLTAAIETRTRRLPADWKIPWTKALLGAALKKQQKNAAAEAVLIEAYDGLIAHRATTPNPEQKILEVLDDLVVVSTSLGKPDRADHWRSLRVKYAPK